MNIYIYIYIYICISIYLYIYLSVCLSVGRSVCLSVCMCMYVYLYLSLSLYIYIYIYELYLSTSYLVFTHEFASLRIARSFTFFKPRSLSKPLLGCLATSLHSEFLCSDIFLLRYSHSSIAAQKPFFRYSKLPLNSVSQHPPRSPFCRSAIITSNRIAIITISRIAIITINRITIVTINRIAFITISNVFYWEVGPGRYDKRQGQTQSNDNNNNTTTTTTTTNKSHGMGQIVEV